MGSDQSWRGRRLHFVGIGGVGMSGLALVAQDLGASVTGSDRAERRRLAPLRERGIEVFVGHGPENVPEGSELVYSSGVQEENPERARARQLGLRELQRGELLAELSRMRRCIAVAGTHGKTTTAAMIVEALRGAGAQPGYVVGADLHATSSNGEWAVGPWLVLETDESDRSFLFLDPAIAVLTNVELEHLREYRSRAELDEAFRAFLAKAPQAVIWNRPELLALREGPAVAFDATGVTLKRGASRFEWRGLDVTVPVPGLHNAFNATAALEACRLAGVDLGRAVSAIADFQGTSRRFEFLGRSASGAQIYDDWAHHPTEVRVTLTAARELATGRLVAVFQPVNWERVEVMAAEFGEALSLADLVVVLGLFLTHEPPPGRRLPTSKPVARAAAKARGRRTVSWIPSMDAAERYLSSQLRAGDLCVFLGSGNIDLLARRLVRDSPAASCVTRAPPMP